MSVRHERRALRVERRRVLVEQQNARLGESGHEQRQRLPLSAGEQPDLRREPVLEAELKRRQLLAEALAAGLRDSAPSPRRLPR